MATLLPTPIASDAKNLSVSSLKYSYKNSDSCSGGNNFNMVLQSYGFNINSDDDECTELNNELNNRKSVNYSDTMIAMSPFAGDYPPATNYINYTDLDANYAAPGKASFICFIISGTHALENAI